jgi:hypothetical protein
MHFSSVIATALLLLSQPASAQNMTEICAGAPGIQGCTGAIKIPVKAQLKTCRTKYYSVCTTFDYQIMANSDGNRLIPARPKRPSGILAPFGATRLECVMAQPVFLVCLCLDSGLGPSTRGLI